MFETLSTRLENAIDKVRGYGKISEDNIKDILKDVRLALLDADVNYQVVKKFISRVLEKSLGEEVQKSLKPSELFVKILKDELVAILGSENKGIYLDGKPSILMLVGLQGSGKTTTIGKLALFLRKKYKKKPLLVACDIYRPAAIDQLKQIGKQLDIEVFSKENADVNTIAKEALIYAKENSYDYVLIDTAGRLHIDENMMEELQLLEEEIKANETLLVIDSMMGQDAINIINGFNDKLKLSGVILTKLDGDTKGGVALSVKELTNLDIKFIGNSEKMDGLDLFYPERMASRILGMGDLLSIVEKAESVISKEEAEIEMKKLKEGKFDLDDFLKQLKQIKKLGPLENILKMMPGVKKMGLDKVKINPKDLLHVEAMILSMTPKERKSPDIIKAKRKIRIAKGSGMQVNDVNRLLKQFEEMKKMMKMFKNGNMKLPF